MRRPPRPAKAKLPFVLDELLRGILDYAGLFPPARLGMAEAVESYLRYRSGPENGLVNRFLCPASRLQELVQELAHREASGVPVGVIGTAAGGLDEFHEALEADARAMTAFEEIAGEIAELKGYEARLPPGVDVRRASANLRAFDKVEVFLELPWSESQADDLAVLAQEEWLGAKARTGGLTAADFPSAEPLALFLKSCQSLDVPFKLTAGLHQPMRHYDEGTRAWHHGFLNVLAALALNDAHDLSRSQMEEILEANDLEWTPHHVGWNGLEARARDTHEVRDLFVGFGSCSVEEPMEGLAQMGLVQGGAV
jgi:hypothetical protein